jgi:hypothetical protein
VYASNPVYAAFWNTGLVRYVDFKDAVHSLESIQVRDLMNLLGSVQVRPPSGR